MPLVPSYLLVLILVLIVLPSLTAIFLRIALNLHLVDLEKRVSRLINKQSRGKQPPIVEELERRFKEASSNLDQVNTAALIEQIYSQEKIKFISCEEIEYFCRILPSLLLAFGLLGTFLGITISLSALSQTISQTNASDVSSLVQELQQPLQGMGIAFITSLTGLFFSALLTVVNFFANTGLAKYKLISSLEDYLDNVYLPTLNGQTRLDKVVNGMANQFNIFLTNFGETVRDAVESSIGGVAQQIAQDNKQATDLATQVYSRFIESSGTIASAADIFKNYADAINQSQFPERLAAASENINNLSQVVLTLHQITQDFKQVTHQLVELGEALNTQNRTSTEVLALTQSNQETFGKIIPHLSDSANILQACVANLNELQDRVSSKADGLSDVQSELTKIVEGLNTYTQGLLSGVQELGNNLTGAIAQQAESHNVRSVAVTEKIEQSASHLSQLAATLKDYIEKRVTQELPANHPQDTIQTPDASNYTTEYQRASSAYQQGKYTEAAEIVERLVPVFPNNVNLRKLRGDVCLKLQEYSLAESEYQLLLSLSFEPGIINYAKKGLEYINKITQLNN